MSEKQITYKSAGVDIDAGDKAVNLIKEEVSKTFPLFGEVKLFRIWEGSVLLLNFRTAKFWPRQPMAWELSW